MEVVARQWIPENAIPIIALAISGWALWRTHQLEKLNLDQTQIKMWSDLIQCNSDTTDVALRAAIALLWIEDHKSEVPENDRSLLHRIAHAIGAADDIDSTVASADEQMAEAGEPFTRKDIVNLQESLSAQELYRSTMVSILNTLEETRGAMKDAIHNSSSGVTGSKVQEELHDRSDAS